MVFLAVEIWPWLLGALAIGLVTGWLAGCRPRRVRSAQAEREHASREDIEDGMGTLP